MAGRTRKAGPNTRDHILDVSCRLLNAHGVDRVTTRMIADTARVNEGNLYYYFRTKDALHHALIDRFEAAAVALLMRPCDAGMAFFDTLLRDLLGLAQDYRFLVTDLSPVLGAPRLRARMRRLSANVGIVVEQAVEDMKARGLIDFDRGQRDRLLANSWIVSTYWMHYLMLHAGIRKPAPRHLAWGIEQVRALYLPYLTEQGRADLALADGQSITAADR